MVYPKILAQSLSQAGGFGEMLRWNCNLTFDSVAGFRRTPCQVLEDLPSGRESLLFGLLNVEPFLMKGKETTAP